MNHMLEIFLRSNPFINIFVVNLKNVVRHIKFDFKVNLRTRDAIFCMRVLFQKCYDILRDAFIFYFLDCKRAFDNIRHTPLMNLLRDLGIHENNL